MHAFLPLTLIALGLLVFAALVVSKIRQHERRRRRSARRRRNVAYQRAWDWLMRRPKHLQLTHRATDADI